MKIMKASAGSGKTYTLSKTYIQKLLSSSDRYEYRHILAVTFTNKATAEMKGRILSDLYELSATNSDAKRILTDILHDYGAFSVSTIDKFFQHALKAFSREIGQFSSYQIELDKDSLIREAMDRILDGLTEEDCALVDWLKRNVMEAIEQGLKPVIDEGLMDMGRRIRNDEHRELLERYGLDDAQQFSKERLSSIASACRTMVDSFHHDVKAAAEKAFVSFAGTDAGDKLVPYLSDFKRWEIVPKPGVRMMEALAGTQFLSLFEDHYRAYRTACLIQTELFSLGLSGEFLHELETLMKERNVMPLDDSNTILRDIIDGSDAPFIYEKLGVKYTSFLLDEFQDTSNIQWKNFLPLLMESESNGKESLVVGDIKQSIYRWRDSDWRLLGEEVGREFRGAEFQTLDNNWRSVENVVKFNNDFFLYAARRTGTSDIYADVSQFIKCEDQQKGGVHLSFVDDELSAVLESIREARDAGAAWSDIAILVRYRKEGSLVASTLIDNGIPVISDDSLSLKSSLVARRLVSLLRSFENPTDTVGGYLAASMGVEFPDSYHSLVDLCENLLRSLRVFDPESYEGETLFVQAFMDDLQSWVQTNGNNLKYYLEHWDDSDIYIGSPVGSDSVRVLTIHKSKGLEFPYAIFPFAEMVSIYEPDVHWCWLDASGTELGDEFTGIYPVNLNSDSADTLFSDAYFTERRMQMVDNINLFYVAFTRAEKYLHVISKIPSKNCVRSCGRESYVFTNFSEVLYSYCRSTDWRMGEMYDFVGGREDKTKKNKTAAAEQVKLLSTYPSIPLAGRLVASEDAMDYFGEDGSTGTEASARLKGIALHKILSGVRRPSDLRNEVDAAVRSGLISEDEGAEAFVDLSDRINAHPEWFDDAVSVRNEVALYDSYGKERRPDRVVFTEDGVIVVDYKFGAESPDHVVQVERYIDIYRQLGYADVTGAVWYVREDKVINIK